MLVTESMYIMCFLKICLFLAALGLHCCVGLSLAAAGLSVAVCRLL